MLEVSVTYVIEKTNTSRKHAVFVMILIVAALGIPPLMSYGPYIWELDPEIVFSSLFDEEKPIEVLHLKRNIYL